MKNLKRPFVNGFLGTVILLGLYFLVLTLVSGWSFATDQFSQFWYFVTALALGFGIQLGLYSYLKTLVSQKDESGKMVAVTGTTSTAAMISCCAHYLVNILPILGVTGVVTVISQYQVQFFWIGLAFNLFGIYYVANRILKYKNEKN